MEPAEEKVYKAFGLSLVSEIPLPELPQITEGVDTVDVSIGIADLTQLWSELIVPPLKFVAKANMFMFKIPKIATFYVHGGDRILVSPEKDSDEDEIRLFLLGTCMGGILMQRKILPLHGSAINIDGKAYCFIGEAGAGKSTLASAFLNRGYKLLSDDVIPVSLVQQDNIPFVTPSYPQQKLWQESLQEFGMENKGYRSIYKRETKFAVPVPLNFFDQQLPLAGVFELKKTNSEKIQIQEIERLDRLKTLLLHTYRNFLIPHSGLMAWHFNISTSIAHHASFYRLNRPNSGFTAPELVSLILSILNKEGK